MGRADEGPGGLRKRAPDGATPGPGGRAPVTLALVLACLGGTLLVSAAHKSICVGSDWSDGRQYRWYCYTDITPLFGTEQLAGGRLPYLDPCASAAGNCDEYPVLTMYFMRIAAWASGEHTARFFWVNASLLAVCAGVIAVGLYLMDPRRALWFVLAPSLALEAFVNWDLFAVALTTAGLVAFVRRREGWAGGLLGLGAAAKLYPSLLLVPFAAERLHQRRPDRAIALWWSAAAAWLLVDLPFAFAGLRGWWEFFRFSAARPADWDSPWYIACRQVSVCPSTGPINLLSMVAVIGAVTLLWAAKRRREPSFPRWQLGFPILVVFLLMGKVYSPQFSLWLLPWLALEVPRLRHFIAFEAADLAVFVTRFSFFGELTGVGGLPQWIFETAVLVRAGVLVWCVAAWVREPCRRLAAEATSPRAPAMGRA